MPALPEYVRFYAGKTWADLPQKTTPIISLALAHWDDWHKRTRDRVEELAAKIALLDAGGVQSLPRPAGAAQNGALFIEQADGTVKRLPRAGNNLTLSSGATEPMWVESFALPTATGAGHVLVTDSAGEWYALPPSDLNGVALMSDPLGPARIAWGDPTADAYAFNEGATGVLTARAPYWDAATTLAPESVIFAQRTGKQVRIDGKIGIKASGNSASAIPASTVIYLRTLPPNMRPTSNLTFNAGTISVWYGANSVYSQNVTVTIYVETNGAVSFSINGSGTLAKANTPTDGVFTLCPVVPTYNIP